MTDPDSPESFQALIAELDALLEPLQSPKVSAESSAEIEALDASQEKGQLSQQKSTLPDPQMGNCYNYFKVLNTNDTSTESSVFKDPLRVLCKRYEVTTSNGPLYIDNWKFREFDFFRRSDEMPCRARGLFTTSTGIVARGYDKFYNYLELSPIKQKELQDQCEGPFNVSLKENGCIIFFAGLPDFTLLVCLKNVTGDLNTHPNRKPTHYEQGIILITRQLEKLGLSTRELGRELYENRLTAIAELCDDAYEEHVVSYPPDIAGLYLHGLNRNTKEFETLNMDTVANFADRWGFKKVYNRTFASFTEFMAYITEVNKTGCLNGHEIEGFVIRCKRQGKSYFLKYKFKEPYGLYRQLREATTKCFGIDSNRNLREVASNFSSNKYVTFAYLEFAQKYFEENPEKLAKFHENIGILELRYAFLKFIGFGENDGKSLVALDGDEGFASRIMEQLESSKTLYCLLTMAVPGCGKTTTLMTLSNLFPDWVLFQNDNYRNAGEFYTDILKHFLNSQMVMVDRMNYRRKYRKEVFDSLSKYRNEKAPDVALEHIGVNFLRLDNVCVASIAENQLKKRGDNHQSLKAKSCPNAAISQLKNNLAGFEKPQLKLGEPNLPVLVKGSQLSGTDDMYSLVINVDIDGASPSLTNAKIIYQQLRENISLLDKGDISELKWQAAFEAALNYQPEFRKSVSNVSRKPLYYALKVDHEPIVAHLSKALAENPTWKAIQQNMRVQLSMHVTLAHADSVKNDPAMKEAWQRLGREFAVKQKKKFTENSDPSSLQNVVADLTVEKIVVIEKVLIALKVSATQFYTLKNDKLHRIEPITSTNKYLHVTVGTRTNAIRPKESNTYLCQLYEQEVGVGEYKFKNFTAQVYDWKKCFPKLYGFIAWRSF